MTQATLVATVSYDEDAAVPAPASTPARGRRTGPVVAMAAGLVFLVVSAAVLVTATGRTDRRAEPAPAVAAPQATADPLAITLSARDISVVEQVYGPGDASGWHAHSGIHAVAVLSGVLTVYDGDCRAQTFEPGRPYVGGQELHLVRNEGTSPVVMTVTYLSPSSGNEPTRRLPAPAACERAGVPVG